MTGLASKFFNSIKDKNKELICLYATELKDKLGDDIMDTMVKIFDYKMAVDRGSEGEKTEFHHDFVKQMCSQTMKE
jgi:NAD(P)H-flavin reductase